MILMQKAKPTTPDTLGRWILLRVIWFGILVMMGVVWKAINIDGNALALAYLGLFAGTFWPWWLREAVPYAPSLFQLLLTEDLHGVWDDWRVAFIAGLMTILDLLGPALGWFVANRIEPSAENAHWIPVAVIVAALGSWGAQYVGWKALKFLFGPLFNKLVALLNQQDNKKARQAERPTLDSTARPREEKNPRHDKREKDKGRPQQAGAPSTQPFPVFQGGKPVNAAPRDAFADELTGFFRGDHALEPMTEEV